MRCRSGWPRRPEAIPCESARVRSRSGHGHRPHIFLSCPFSPARTFQHVAKWFNPSRSLARTPQAVVRPLSACQQSFGPASRAHYPAPPHTASAPSCDRAEGRKLTAVRAPRSVRRPSRRAHPAQDCLPGRQRRWLGLCVALSGSSRAMTQILTSVDTQRAWLPSSTSTPRCALGLCGPFGREDSEG